MELTLESFSKYLEETHKRILDAAKGFLIDREVKIIDPNFNDQPFGRSKPKLTGRKYKVIGVCVTDGKIYVRLDDVRHYMSLTQIEVI